MSEDLVREMRNTYGASKQWWCGVIALWFLAAALAGATQFPFPAPVPAIAAGVGFLGAVLAFAVRWRAELHYQTAEGLRRALLRADGFGEAIQPAVLAQLRRGASERDSTDPAPLGAYYTSGFAGGARRVLHNVQESAFYTEPLARRAGWTCTCVVGVVLFIGIVLLFVTVNTRLRPDDAASVGNAVLGSVTAMVGGTLADLARAYFSLAHVAAACFERTRSLLDNKDVQVLEALRAADAYDAALTTAPPIPGFLYRRMQVRLDKLWENARSPEGDDRSGSTGAAS